MGRVIFPKNKQAEWINLLFRDSNVTTNEIANICGVSLRTIRDWRREKYTISEKALLKLSTYFNLAIPVNIKHVSNFWYVSKGAKKGALKRLLLYGPPGTPEGRIKGGKNSQKRRRENPEKYRQLGCYVRKNIISLQATEQFAESTGIILGDGGITKYQLKISLGSQTDREYAFFVKELFRKVFNEIPAWYEYKSDHVIELCISGANLIEELSRWGLEKGNKIHRQVDFPLWIWKSQEYQKACVRGLMDTDGGVYFHCHTTKGIAYRHLGICFTSWSKPLLTSVIRVLTSFNIKHSSKEGRIYIYDLEVIKKFFDVFGSNNPKHIGKLKYHLSHDRKITKPGGVA